MFTLEIVYRTLNGKWDYELQCQWPKAQPHCSEWKEFELLVDIESEQTIITGILEESLLFKSLRGHTNSFMECFFPIDMEEKGNKV